MLHSTSYFPDISTTLILRSVESVVSRAGGGGGGAYSIKFLTLSLPASVTETLKVALIFESLDEILWCDHSSETSSSAVLSHGTIYI